MILQAAELKVALLLCLLLEQPHVLVVLDHLSLPERWRLLFLDRPWRGGLSWACFEISVFHSGIQMLVCELTNLSFWFGQIWIAVVQRETARTAQAIALRRRAHERLGHVDRLRAPLAALRDELLLFRDGR